MGSNPNRGKKNFFLFFLALMAISATGEGCHKQMESYLPEIMNGVINFINDPVSIFIKSEKLRFFCTPDFT